ncbi:MAG: zinc-binding dehydrogenase [Sphaerochaetaceae bacterium]|nr:zinc-binding dehydrogenase [Sphaerochaetaceae bacterium]
MAKSVILEKIGQISYRELQESDVYKPTPQEEVDHGTKVVTRQIGDPLEGEIETEAVLGAVCTHEVSLFLGDLTHPRYPMVPGHEAVHRVTRVGKGVSHLKEGDYVSCCWYMGQWSRKVIGPASVAWRLPEDIKDPAHWVVEPVASIVNAASYMEIKPGSKILLVGAGFMGLLMAQIISRYPLAEFTVADLKPFNLELAQRAGAYTIIQTGTEEGQEYFDQLPEGSFDIVIECSGSQKGLDLAIQQCGMAGHIYLFGWHRKTRTVDFKLGHLRGQHFLHTSPAADFGKVYERYWPTTIELMRRGVFDLSYLITHKYKAEEINQCMQDSVSRTDGFIKSVFYLE